MVSITDTLKACFDFLSKVKELEGQEPSVLEIGQSLGWNYPKASNIAKALEELGLIKRELYQGMPRKYIVRLTKKGECIISCISA